MKAKLEKFIKDNKLTFEKGRRNSDCCVIVGYTQYLEELDSESYRTHITDVLKERFRNDTELKHEFDKVWDHADYYSWCDWWKDDKNRSKFKL